MIKNDHILFSDGKWHYCIVKPSEAEVVEEFAISELKKYLSKITGQPIEVKAESIGSAIKVGRQFAEYIEDIESLGQNGFVIQSYGKDIIISSCGEKGVLNGVYEFLEILGCRWYYPGSGEIIPKCETLRVTKLNIRKKPSFSTITLFYSNITKLHPELENDHALLDWMGKNKMTTIVGTRFDKEEPDEWCSETNLCPAKENEECRKRAISKEFGGHVMTTLLPRHLFDNHPEYFPLGRDGKRNKRGNVCCSNKEVLEIIQKNAVELVKKHEGDVFHLWGRDVKGGAWCSCENCREMPVQEQYMSIINSVAKAIEKIRPNIRVGYIAYHDTLLPESKIKPRHNVLLLFAPRERCYGHPINSTECKTNLRIHQALKNYLKIFESRNTAIFEYYGDSILYCGIAASIPSIIAADLKEYFKMGIGEVGFLMMGAYTWWAHPINNYVFAKLAFDVETNIDELMRDYTRHMFPSASDEMFAYYKNLEETVGLLLRTPDWRYVLMRQALTEELKVNIEEVLSRIVKLQAKIEKVNNRLTGQEKQRLQKERNVLEVTRLLVSSFKNEMLGTLRLKKQRFKEAFDYFTKAEKELEEMIMLLEKIDPKLLGSFGQRNMNRIKKRLLLEIRKRKTYALNNSL